MRKERSEDIALVNFNQLIRLFARPLFRLNIEVAMNFYVLISDLQFLHAELECAISENLSVCASLLGQLSESGTRIAGVIDKFSDLLGGKEFLRSLALSAAKKCESADLFEDALRIFNLFGEYEHVLSILCGKMGDSLVSFDRKAVQGLVESSRAILDFYLDKISEEQRRACFQLTRILESKIAWDSGSLDLALSMIDELGIVPTSCDFAMQSQKFDEMRFLDESIRTHFSIILEMYMGLLHAIYVSIVDGGFVDAGRQMVGSELS